MTTAHLPAPGAPEGVYLLDLSLLAQKAHHAAPPELLPTGEPCHVTKAVWRRVVRILADRRPAYLCAALDAPGAGWRAGLVPSYRAHHDPPSADYEVQIDRLRQLCALHEIPCLLSEVDEAADHLAPIARRALDTDTLRPVIVSAHKGLYPLLAYGEGALLWDGHEDDPERGPAWVLDEHAVLANVKKFGGVPAWLVPDLLALAGSKSRGLAGLPNVGPARAAKLLATAGALCGRPDAWPVDLEDLLRHPYAFPHPLSAELGVGLGADRLRAARAVLAVAAAPASEVPPLPRLVTGWSDAAPIRAVLADLGMGLLAGDVRPFPKRMPPMDLVARWSAS